MQSGGPVTTQFLKARGWNVVFVDLSGAGAAGVEMIGVARRRRPLLRITVLDDGGHGSGLDRLARAVALGAEEFMCKPVDRDDADAALDRLGL